MTGEGRQLLTVLHHQGITHPLQLHFHMESLFVGCRRLHGREEEEQQAENHRFRHEHLLFNDKTF